MSFPADDRVPDRAADRWKQKNYVFLRSSGSVIFDGPSLNGGTPLSGGPRDTPGLAGKLEENQAGVVYQNTTTSRSHPSATPVNREMAMMARTCSAIRAGLA